MKKIFVSGKLNGCSCEYIKNLHQMVRVTNEIRDLGFAVFCPGIDILLGFLDGNFEYDDYFDNNVEFLKVCDALYVMPDSEKSEGVKKEREIAEFWNIPIFESLEDLKEVLRW